MYMLVWPSSRAGSAVASRLPELLCPGGAVILDEPFTGLDTAARDACAEVVLDLLDGRMLLLATHDVADAQALDISDIITL